MQTIKVQVRIEGGEDWPIAFWRENGELCCFTWFDGHIHLQLVQRLPRQ